MSVRKLVGVLAVLVSLFASTHIPAAVAAEPGEPCYGGLMTETDESGVLSGTECSDVILASTETTSIEAGDGDDVVIGGANVVLIEGGEGEDYIIGDGLGTIAMGGEGDDILDAGNPPAAKNLSASRTEHLNLAAAQLSDAEAKDFQATVKAALAEARTPGRITYDPEARQNAIATNELVSQVVNPSEVAADHLDEDQVAEIQVAREEATAYGESLKTVANRSSSKISGGQVAMRNLSDEIYGDPNQSDWLYGGRGNDKIYGRSGDDQLYGGVGDDLLEGNDDHDYLLGGMGADQLDGGVGNDVAQGDATGDKMVDTGTSTGDVLSYASGGSPGFPDTDLSTGYPNFPTGNAARGVRVDLTAGSANNGSVVDAGGGIDPAGANINQGTRFQDFERVMGTAFADYIKGDAGDNVLQGGGGSDILIGGGGTDVLIGEAGGDNLKAGSGSWLVGGAGDDHCSGSTALAQCDGMPSNWVSPRNSDDILVGMTTQTYVGNVKSQLYLSGSTANWVTENGEDDVTVTQISNSPNPPIFRFEAPSNSLKGQFSIQAEDQTPGCVYTTTVVTCTPASNVVTLVMAGFGSNDTFDLTNVSRMTNTVFLGGFGHDNLVGGNYTEDFMHGGDNDDYLNGQAADDGLVNTEGTDDSYGGDGDDLILSSVACQNDYLGGGDGEDNASWAQYKATETAGSTHGVYASIAAGLAGRNVGASLDCSGIGPAIEFLNIEDLEGTKHNDAFYGGPGADSLLGRATTDRLTGYGGADSIMANASDNDNIFCGSGSPDQAFIDWPANGNDSTDGNCESIVNRDSQYDD